VEDNVITYRIMDETCPLSSCLHSGPLPLCNADPAYVETISDIPAGSVVRTLNAICARYGACGVLAIENDMVIGKIRAYPQAIIDRNRYACLQQEQTVRPLLALALNDLPMKDEYPVLHLACIQVASEYCGCGVAGGMLDTLIAWARANGWRELRAIAVSHIPPLLNWCGQLSRGALERRGFTFTASAIGPELREGAISQRRGDHGEAVREQWKPYAHISDDEAGTLFDMALSFQDR